MKEWKTKVHITSKVLPAENVICENTHKVTESENEFMNTRTKTQNVPRNLVSTVPN